MLCAGINVIGIVITKVIKMLEIPYNGYFNDECSLGAFDKIFLKICILCSDLISESILSDSMVMDMVSRSRPF